jgi:Glycosyl transferase family 2
MRQNNIGYPLQPLCTKRASSLTTLASEGCGMTITNTSGVTAPAAPPALEQLTRQRVSIVIPAINEARNLEHVFAALPAGLHEVIVVDGHSTDGTPQIARQLLPGVRVITQTRKGKGNALACGFAAVTGDIIVMIDADGSTNPAEIWARHLPVFGLLPDSPGQQPVWGDGFEIETLLNLRAATAGLAIAEVPSFEHDRLHGTSDLKTFRDGQRVLRTIVTERSRG